MNELHSSQMKFLGYRISNIDYKCDPSFELETIENGQIFMNYAKCKITISENSIQENLRANVCFNDKPSSEGAKLLLEVEICGRFETTEKWEDRWENNALAILFPYIRTIVSTITSISGREPILLPTVNINQLFDDKEKTESK